MTLKNYLFTPLILLSILLFAACSGKKKSKLSACDCKTKMEELVKNATGAGSDKDKEAALKKEAEILQESCKDFKQEDYKDCK